MRLTSFNYQSLKKHKITEQQCLEVTDDENSTTEEFDEGYNRAGNWRIMFVGFTREAELIEVGVEFIKLSDLESKMIGEKYWKHVYHADYATSAWQAEYNDARKRKV